MNNKNIKDFEEQLLSTISGDFNTSDVLKTIVEKIDEAGEEAADGWLELVQDALTQKQDPAGMLKLMVIRGRIGRITPKAIEEALIHSSKDRVWQAKVKSCEFTGKDELPQCFRKLTVLKSIKEGTFCSEKTWGFGVVRRLDPFYSRITVDFTRKKQHQMAFSYAGEALQILNDTHIYVILNKAPEKMAEILKNDPGEIVRMLLRSTGPQIIDDVKDLLVEIGIIKDADWKSFWDAARKALKKDSLVQIPTKRTEPITILDKEKGYDSDWVKDLLQERDLMKLLVMFEGLVDSGQSELPMEAHEAIVNRCAFVCKAAEGSQWAVLARLIIVAEALSPILGRNPVDGKIDDLFSRKPLTEALRGLNVRLGTSLLDLMMRKDADKASAVLTDILEDLPVNLVGDAAYHLKKAGREDMFMAKISQSINAREIGPVVFSWVCRTPGAINQLKDVSRYELVNGVIDMLEGEFNGEQLKGQNAVRTCFEDKDWLAALFVGLPAAQMETLVRRIADSKGWEEASRRSVLAKLLKVDATVAKVLSAPAVEVETKLKVTSWRSFKERSATLKKIVEVDIPENSKEIGVARSYGDLRENHEYKAAKEHQGILMRRQEELERDLKTVQGTDFRDFPADKAGPGTIVRIRRPDGREEEYCILGEWDRDEALNIISSESKLAQCLEGARASDTVILPGHSGNEKCAVISIAPPSDAVRAWITSDPA